MGTLKQTNTKGVFTRNSLPPSDHNTILETRVCEVDLGRIKGAQVSITEHRSGAKAVKYTVSMVTRSSHVVTFDIRYVYTANCWRASQFVNTVHAGYQNRYFVGTASAATPEEVFETVLISVDKMIYGI